MTSKTPTISYERLLQILQDYVNADVAEASELEYIRETLVDTCGCSKDELEELGLDWIFPEDYWDDDPNSTTPPNPPQPIDFNFEEAVADIDTLSCGESMLVRDEEGNIFKLTKHYDEMGINDPRDDDGNLGSMVCWHNRYTLGDEQPSDDPDKWLAELLRQEMSGFPCYGAPVYTFLAKGTDYVRLAKENGQYQLQVRQTMTASFETVSSVTAPSDIRDIPDWFLADCCEALTINQTMMILTKELGYYFMPLYLYDHSGITMSTNDFGDKWDSGRVGWIYTTQERAKELWQTDWDEERAQKELTAEVAFYDRYLSGEAYGIEIEKFDPHIDMTKIFYVRITPDKASDSDFVEYKSCWGFAEATDMVDFAHSTLGNYAVWTAEETEA